MRSYRRRLLLVSHPCALVPRLAASRQLTLAACLIVLLPLSAMAQETASPQPIDPQEVTTQGVTPSPSTVQPAAAQGGQEVEPGAERGADRIEGPIEIAIQQAADRGIEFLRQRGQLEDGSFSPETGSAVTALCLRAILELRPQAINDPVVQRGLKYIESMIQGDGGIYARGSLYRNYETSVAVGALVRANQDGRYDSVLSRAELFLRDLQWDESEGVNPEDPAYGGAGYGTHQRPDLSNTSFLIDALKDLGNDSEDEAIQKALTFVLRTQNLAGHGNDTPHADDVGDGGFYYTPAAGGQSQAGQAEGGGLRSYGSMTYAGLKSMIYAGLTADDPRVQAAMDFIRRTYSLTENPGMGQAGLFYYYHTFAKALRAAEVDILDDAAGKPRAWREELARHLISLQQEDGSWVNTNSDRWMEGDRQLVTAYALLALAYSRQEN